MEHETTYEQQIAVTNRLRLVVADDDEALVRLMLCSQLEYEFECIGPAADAE